MDNENRQDGAEPSLASDGSVAGEPVAWAVVCGDCVDSMFTDRDKAVEWAGRLIPPAHIVPLYRVPTLTDAEREAIKRLLHWVADRPCSQLPVDVETDHSIACEVFERMGGGR
jgi:hypothetical protein